jgi:hypothetical protein
MEYERVSSAPSSGSPSARKNSAYRQRVILEDQRQDVEALQTEILGFVYRAQEDAA